LRGAPGRDAGQQDRCDDAPPRNAHSEPPRRAQTELLPVASNVQCGFARHESETPVDKARARESGTAVPLNSILSCHSSCRANAMTIRSVRASRPADNVACISGPYCSLCPV
jgi:hypothetical protein